MSDNIVIHRNGRALRFEHHWRVAKIMPELATSIQINSEPADRWSLIDSETSDPAELAAKVADELEFDAMAQLRSWISPAGIV